MATLLFLIFWITNKEEWGGRKGRRTLNQTGYDFLFVSGMLLGLNSHFFNWREKYIYQEILFWEWANGVCYQTVKTCLKKILDFQIMPFCYEKRKINSTANRPKKYAENPYIDEHSIYHLKELWTQDYQDKI